MTGPRLLQLFSAMSLGCAALLVASVAAGAPVLPDFGSATFDPNQPIDNPYFPMTGGSTLRYTGSEDGEPIDTYFEHAITTDAGAKALTINKPGPWVIGEKDFRYNAGSDEFGVITYETAQRSYKVGDKLELIVPHCDPVVNEYDQMYAIKNDRVSAVWPISARGKSQ